MRYYITTDLEGAAGVERFNQTYGDEPFKLPAMRQLTREVNAAVEGILDAYPNAQIDVADGHGAGGIVREAFTTKARYLRGPENATSAGQSWTFEITPGDIDFSQAPVSVSYDRFHWAPVDRVGPGNFIRHRFERADAILSTTPPYTNGMLYEFSLWVRRSRHARVDWLGGRMGSAEPLTCITISENSEVGNKPVVWVTAREHPAEAAASWVAEGIVRYLLSPDPVAAALRQQYCFVVFPLLDAQGVATGAVEPQTTGAGAADTPGTPPTLALQYLETMKEQGATVTLAITLRGHTLGAQGHVAARAANQPPAAITEPAPAWLAPAWAERVAQLLPWHSVRAEKTTEAPVPPRPHVFVPALPTCDGHGLKPRGLFSLSPWRPSA